MPRTRSTTFQSEFKPDAAMQLMQGLYQTFTLRYGPVSLSFCLAGRLAPGFLLELSVEALREAQVHFPGQVDSRLVYAMTGGQPFPLHSVICTCERCKADESIITTKKPRRKKR